MNPLAIIAIVFGSLAVVLLGVTLVLVQRTRRRLAGTVRVDGSILALRGDVQSRRDGDYGTRSVQVRLPTLVYTDPSTEREHTFESADHTGLPVGAKLPVRVRPGEPNTAFVPSFSRLWVGPLLLGIMTLGFLAAAVGLAVVGATLDY